MFLASGSAAEAATQPSQTATQNTAQSTSSSDFTHACGQKPTKGRFTCFVERRTNVHEPLVLAPDATPQGYTPADIQSAYNLPAATGSPLVAIIDAFDDPDAESDLAVYRSQFGLPACTTANGCFQKVAQDGSTNYPPPPPAGDDWVSEITLDLDAVSAACPNCRILLVEANTDADGTSLPDAVATARNMGAKIISMSWGGSEDGTENSEDAQYFDYPGIVFTASSGDYGYSEGPIYPSTSQYTVSVGGTTLDSAPGTTRGWTESAWSGAGSGCSADVTKPSWQSGITACTTRADTDISADADPNTGIAVYNSYSDSGWDVYGGTSLASPLIAAMYAIAGGPAAGTEPASYPYDDPNQSTDINDVTSGSTGSCTPSVLCTAGQGWDGPTGLGTPNGVGAFTSGPHGNISGVVTDAGTGKPVAGATVTASGGYTATTDATGAYNLGVPPGSYSLSVSDYGYVDGTASSVAVTDGATVTENFALTDEAMNTVSGTITDGSGHKWPIRAKITISGYPGGSIYSNAYNGKYSVRLPDNASYTLSVAAADLPGYETKQVTVKVAAADVTKNIKLLVDPSVCDAPGYAYKDTGLTESFTGWTGNAPQDGWTVTDNAGTGQTWRFDNVANDPPPPGGDADFADVNSDYYGQGGQQNTDLVSPVIDLSAETDPEIGFDSTYIGFPTQTAEVDLSLDGGTTWSSVWTPYAYNPGHFDIPIPQAAGQSDVRVRFAFTGSWARHWAIDNVLVGDHTCSPVTGGIVDGVVTDANTAAPVDGATVTSDADSSASGVSGPTTADPALPDGYYWLFSPQTGSTTFTATDGHYTATTGTAKVAANAATRANLKLDAGQLTVNNTSVSVSEVLGKATSKTVTYGNSGTAPVTVSLSGEDAGFTSMDGVASSGGTTAAGSANGAAPMVVAAKTSTAPTASSGSAAGAVARQASPEAAPWTDVADYPEAIMDDAVADHDGEIYVIGGSDGDSPVPDANVYDPSADTWSSIAPLPAPLNASSAGFIGDTLYVAGGWDSLGDPSDTLYAYDPASNTWTQDASLPAGVAAAGSAVVSGKLYIIGGSAGSTTSDAVYSYDPGDNSWTTEPAYPDAMAFPACGGVDAEVICAGGDGASDSTYAYSPGATGWVQEANMPTDAWGAASASANGQLEVMGGAINDGADVTNEAYAYDPGSNTWSALPASNNATYRGGAACGIYKVGGALGGFTPAPFTENLPGYDQCDGEVAWMSLDSSSFTLAPGQTAQVTVTADSSVESQPGTYQAEIVASANTPYETLAPVGVTMAVTPPSTWGKITGTVSDASGAPIAGATVAICTMYSTQTGLCGPETFTLKTDGAGHYQLWLDKGFNPLQIIAAEDGYTPVMKIAKITKGGTTTTNFTLASSSAATQAAVQRYLGAHLQLRTG
ncbi:MAG TPA: carboxypeptidase regulatory-like domain-containing protein [Trebonia sp.]|nr:carboxypeptidase regulatory-like domain-containing protein [Trebonia sp.]